MSDASSSPESELFTRFDAGHFSRRSFGPASLIQDQLALLIGGVFAFPPFM
jgi:hypothetical protein